MMNQRPPLQGMANQMAQYGRYGDSMLVHMNPVEVQGIAALSPTGSLTTNPVTGQPEAFLPFLAPLLGSALGSAFLPTMIPALAGKTALASAIGSGLATTAATGNIKKGLVSGITGFGLGKALGAASDALNPEIANIEGALEGVGDAVGAVDAASQAGVDLASASADLVDPLTQATQAGQAFSPVATDPLTSTLPGGSSQIPMSPALTPAQQAVAGPMDKFTAAQTAKTAADAKVNRLTDMLQAERESLTPMERLAAPFANPETFGKALIQPANLAAIGTGEGQRGAIEMQERFARDARFADREKEEALRRAKGNIMDAYRMLEQDYPGYKIPGAQAGGITSVNPSNYMSNLRGLQMLAGGGQTVQNFNQGGRFGRFASSDDYSQYMGTAPVFGPGTAAQRQANIRGSQVISPEQLQGYRPGFGPEIMYFQRPATAPTPTPGTGPMPPGPGPIPTPTPGPTPTPPDLPIRGGGIGDFDYTEFLESDEGRQAMGAVRGALGIPDFSTIDSRLAAIETRPDPTIPTIDYDEITERVRGGIDIPDFDLSGIESRLGAIENRNIPTIDYDTITDRVRSGIDIPDFDLSGIESRLGAIEGREIPTIDYDAITSRVREGIDIPEYTAPTFDYDEIANRVRGSIDIPAVDLSGIESRLGAIEGREMPTFDTSGIMSAIDANRQAIAGLPTTDLSGIESRLGAIEGREMPTFDTSGIMSAIDANRQAISGIPSVDLSGIESRLGAIEGREMPTVDLSGIESRLGAIEGREMPTFDTSNIMSAIDANRQAIAGIPATDFSGIESRLSAIEGRPDPTFDTSGLMSAIDANRQAIAGMPAVDLSGIETRLGAIEGREMPTVDLSGIESRLGAIEGREMPTFDTSGIMSAIDANRQAIAGLPAPTPAFDPSGIMDAIAANRDAISNLPAPAPTVDLSGIESRLGAIESRPDPTFDTSGIMSAIAANREAIAGLPAPAPAFDPSEILAAIEANRKAIGGINSGGINPNPTAGIPTAPVKQAPIRTSPIKLPKGFAEGGETGMPADQGSRIIDLTIAAVMGQLPEDQAEAVINRFVDEFGPEAFAILRRQVLQSNVPGAQTEGEIKGNGGGMDDKVPGMIGDQQPVAVSPGEFIVPADVVSGIGDGSTDAGVEELYGMMDRVRQDRTGTKQQPQPVNKAKVMPV